MTADANMTAQIVAGLVKGLTFENFDAWTFWTKTAVGTYRITERGGLWKCVIHCLDNAHFVAETDNPEAAKAAAEQDYRARIAAALDVEKIAALVEAAHGLSFGEDWNHGTHAKIYRPKLLAALTALQGASHE